MSDADYISTPVDHDPFDPLAASAGVAPAGTPRIDQIDWGQPSWAQQALEQSQKDREAYAKEGVRGVLRDTEESQNLAGGFSDAPLGMGAIRAYHGSPHDFEKFDMSKIGTGEGAQAYGHGLYFAENSDVAKQYREMLGRGDKITVGGQPVDKMYGDYNDQRALQWVQSSARKPSGESSLIDDAISRAQADLDYMRGPRGGAQAAASAEKTLGRLQEWKQKGVAVANPGKTYEVNIDAEPEHFLDWDRPMSEQHPTVRKAFLDNLERRQWPQEKIDDVLSDKTTGQQALNYIMPSGAKSQATDRLREAGIPGIKYLDQGSRNAGGWHITPPDQTVSGKWMVKSSDYNSKGLHFDTEAEAQRALQEKIGGLTHNYVVFNDKLIDIIKKYGLAGLVAGGASHFKTTPTDNDPFADHMASGGKVKMSHASVHYVDPSKYPDKSCGKCSMFLPDGPACTLVQSPIAASGYCVRFDPKKEKSSGIDTSHTVRTGANSSADGKTVFIDPSIPAKFRQFLAVHETVEQRHMAQGYDRAHKIATAAERKAVEAAGMSWRHYTAEMDGFLDHIEHEPNTNPPPGKLHVAPGKALNHHHSKGKS